MSSPKTKIICFAALVTTCSLSTSSGAQPVPTAARNETFRPTPVTTDRYHVGDVEIEYLEAPDGRNIYVELWKPAARPTGPDVASRIPVVLWMTPYGGEGPWDPAGETRAVHLAVRDFFVPKGYAFALGHVYGTGHSEGCLQLLGPKEIAATSAVVEYFGSAGWSNRRVGMMGGSYDAAHALHVAARGSKAAKRFLKAVISEAGVVSWYDMVGHDGVPFLGGATLQNLGYVPISNAPAAEDPGWQDHLPNSLRLIERHASACRSENTLASTRFETTGDFNRWFAHRTARRLARNVLAATLMFHGFHDPFVPPISPVGFFDRLPVDTTHKLVMGQWKHARTALHRDDFTQMTHAWFDRYLMELDSGVEGWPDIQLEDSEGRWRVEPGWPHRAGEAGQLAFDTELLGALEPKGTSTYLELGASPQSNGLQRHEVKFTTKPLEGPLRLTGQPVVDLWVELDKDDAHIAVVLAARDAQGNLITSAGGAFGDQRGRLPITAFRSARHLEPSRNGEFRQRHPVLPPTVEAIRVPIRFYTPVDLVVPTGGTLSLRISSTSMPDFPSSPSGAGTKVKILHDCEHPSMLRFMMPSEKVWRLQVADLDDVPEDEHPQTRVITGDDLSVDAGGLATREVCGAGPIAPQAVLQE